MDNTTTGEEGVKNITVLLYGGGNNNLINKKFLYYKSGIADLIKYLF